MEERKSNKKTRGIIIAAMVLLLVAILCLCGTTFAKYITSTSVPTQQATVAKWGFVVSANANDLFGTEYKAGTKVTASTDGVDVQSSATPAANIVAPGTKGSMTFHVTGSAEVQAALDLAMSKVKEITLTTGGTTYTAVKWTLKSGTSADNVAATTDTTDKTLTELIAAVKKAETYAPGTSVNLYYELSWEWAFKADVTGMPNGTNEEKKAIADKIAEQDRKDTLLGYAAQGAGTYGDVEVEIDDDTKVITVTDNAPETPVVYTATIELAFDLSISVEQTQATAPSTGD